MCGAETMRNQVELKESYCGEEGSLAMGTAEIAPWGFQRKALGETIDHPGNDGIKNGRRAWPWEGFASWSQYSHPMRVGDGGMATRWQGEISSFPTSPRWWRGLNA